VAIAAAKNDRWQLGQSRVCSSKECSYWCKWQQDGQAVQNDVVCCVSDSCCCSGGAAVGLAARTGRPRFDGGVADATCPGLATDGGDSGDCVCG
jgi:hypothetical protein